MTLEHCDGCGWAADSEALVDGLCPDCQGIQPYTGRPGYVSPDQFEAKREYYDHQDCLIGPPRR